jgi:lactoylglutathione lyase
MDWRFCPNLRRSFNSFKRMNSLEWIILKTEKYAESKRFYALVLNLPVVRESPQEEFCQFQLDNCFLAIYGGKFYDSLAGSNSGRPGAAIYTFAQVADVDRTVRELSAKGVTIIKPPVTQPWGQRTAYFADPDGHIWEIQKWLN